MGKDFPDFNLIVRARGLERLLGNVPLNGKVWVLSSQDDGGYCVDGLYTTLTGVFDAIYEEILGADEADKLEWVCEGDNMLYWHGSIPGSNDFFRLEVEQIDREIVRA